MRRGFATRFGRDWGCNGDSSFSREPPSGGLVSDLESGTFGMLLYGAYLQAFVMPMIMMTTVHCR